MMYIGNAALAVTEQLHIAMPVQNEQPRLPWVDGGHNSMSSISPSWYRGSMLLPTIPMEKLALRVARASAILGHGHCVCGMR
jgi:hypothetical protein